MQYAKNNKLNDKGRAALNKNRGSLFIWKVGICFDIFLALTDILSWGYAGYFLKAS